jgi:hypothetical protein
MRVQAIKESAELDLDKFRLRRFVEQLAAIGEVWCTRSRSRSAI